MDSDPDLFTDLDVLEVETVECANGAESKIEGSGSIISFKKIKVKV